MDAYTFLLLLTASAINMALPGPGIILTFTRSSCRGFAAGARVSSGLLLASFILAAAALLIVAGLMEISPNALAAMRLVGVAVILWIALQLVLAPAAAPSRPTVQPRASDFLAGFALGVTSPFNLVFLLALVPQFVDLASATPALVMLVTAGILAITAVPMFAVSLLAARSGRLGLRWAMGVRRMGGVLLLGFVGLALAGTMP